MYRDVDPAGSGSIWKKTTPSGKTGWVELGGGGGGSFTPIGASIYDGYLNTDANPGYINFHRDDIFIDGSGYSTIRLRAGDDVPPAYDGSDRPWMPYVWYDTGGFVATPSQFTAPEDGVYLVSMSMPLLLTHGFLSDARLQANFSPAEGGGTMPAAEATIVGPLDATDPDLPSLLLAASDQIKMTAGDTIAFELQANMRGLGGMAANSSVLEIQRDLHYNAPPDEHSGGGPFVGPHGTSRFSIAKIA